MSRPDELGRSRESYWAVAMASTEDYRLACSNDSSIALFWSRRKAKEFATALQAEFDRVRERCGGSRVRCRVVSLDLQIVAYASDAERKRAATNKADWIIRPKRRTVRSH